MTTKELLLRNVHNGMTHKEYHEFLHKVPDELMNDFILQTGKTFSDTPIIRLMEWSHQQTINPTEKL